MRTDLDLAEDAAQLISFGLRPKLRAAAEPAYAVLVRRFRSEAALRERVHVISRGLGLAVLGVTDQGIVVGAERDGAFAETLASYRRSGLSVAERLCHGVIQLAIAAWYFPTARALEDPEGVLGARLSTNKLVEYLVGLCNELAARSQTDADAGSPELQEAWRTILSRAETRGTSDGRRTAGTLGGMAAHAFEHLERGGLVRKVEDAQGGVWQALPAYRLHLRELAAHEAFRLVRDAAAAAKE